ncbi:hypothetical protein C2G38_2113768 [Gigaspora rosea]|uniref:Uncharacterized protein n=1 Tax=Gigaspora rosea TaxID=44941 RepID=A0A397UAW1_9GLOM|nr:hypothetical protein C2G38_2113768 [Gigaspora rosea]
MHIVDYRYFLIFSCTRLFLSLTESLYFNNPITINFVKLSLSLIQIYFYLTLMLGLLMVYSRH